ncbi:MAG: protease inhibitor I42 family protein [Chitinophagaceae bacterium]
MLSITLKVGEKHRMPMDQLGSAGYSWEYIIEKGKDIIQITQNGLTVPPVPTTKSRIPSTYEVKLEFIITGIKPGLARVKFFLHRVWEKNKPPLKESSVNITVVR